MLVIDMAFRWGVIMERKRGTSMVQAKRKTVLEDWFKRRVDELGDEAGSWEVLYCSIGLSFLSFFLCSFSFVFFFLFEFSSGFHPFRVQR